MRFFMPPVALRTLSVVRRTFGVRHYSGGQQGVLVTLNIQGVTQQRSLARQFEPSLYSTPAQPQPNAHVVTTALVAGIPLCRAVLNGETS